MAYLGFDISTSVIGISILDDDDNVLLYDCIDLRKFKNYTLFEKIDKAFEIIYNKFAPIIQKYDIKYAGVEAALKKFSIGKSSANVLMALIAFNSIFSYTFSKKFDIEIVQVTFTEARKVFGIKIPKYPKTIKAAVRSDMKKQFIMECVKTKWPAILWSKNKIGNIDKKNYDIADSLVIAFYVKQKIRNSKANIS